MKFILKFSLIPLLLHTLTSHATLTVTNIAAGGAYSLFLKSDGSLWVVGANNSGQLGDGSTNPGTYKTNKPENIVASGVMATAAGISHSLFLKSDGSLWAMGDNSSGQLGAGPINKTNRPQQIVFSGVTTITAGQDHSLFLKSDSSLWGMGENNFGQLGDGTFRYSTNRPEQIVTGAVMAIAAGGAHSLFLKSDGSLWAMGYNAYGQLGDGTTNNVNQPEQIVASGVTTIAAGRLHSLFLESDGSLWAMGYNAWGQLGSGTYYNTNKPEQVVASGVTTIAAAVSHTLFLKSDGSLWATGYNYYGELGDGFIDNGSPFGTSTPEQIIPSPSQALLDSRASKTNLQFTATCGFGGTFYLLAGTNLTQPLSQWTPVATNIINNRTNNLFSATLTNAVNSSNAQQFYIIRSQ